MKKLLPLVLISFLSCNSDNSNQIATTSDNPKTSTNLITDYSAINEDGSINVVIEIPTGSIEKWEVNKTSGQLEWTLKNGEPRKIKYLGYPGNYGMIPRTILPKGMGGDGDPLDILVLGESLERGQVINCKVIGALQLLDNGEQDDKLIGVTEGSPFSEIDSIEELKQEFNGTTKIIETFFKNYKGPEEIELRGFIEKDSALDILTIATESFEKTNKQ